MIIGSSKQHRVLLPPTTSCDTVAKSMHEPATTSQAAKPLSSQREAISKQLAGIG